MTTSWDSFTKRRNVNIAQFLSVNGIKGRVELLAHLLQIGVEPPNEELIEKLFPSPQPVTLQVEEPVAVPVVESKESQVSVNKSKNKNK